MSLATLPPVRDPRDGSAEPTALVDPLERLCDALVPRPSDGPHVVALARDVALRHAQREYVVQQGFVAALGPASALDDGPAGALLHCWLYATRGLADHPDEQPLRCHADADACLAWDAGAAAARACARLGVEPCELPEAWEQAFLEQWALGATLFWKLRRARLPADLDFARTCALC
eukprot:m51a1_g3619 hypothetical protein (176) ;mRNA; r:85179-85706